jgi:hypothetical protein
MSIENKWKGRKKGRKQRDGDENVVVFPKRKNARNGGGGID